MRPPPSCVSTAKVCLNKVTHCTLGAQSTLGSLLGTFERKNFGFLSQVGRSGNSSRVGSITSSGNRGSSITSGGNSGDSSNTVSNLGRDNRGTSSITNMLNSPLDTDSLVGDSVDRGVDGGGNLLNSVGLGLVDKGLGDLLDGPHGSSNSLTSIGGDVLEDGLGNMGGLHNGSRLVGGNGGRDMGVGSLSHGVGDGGDLGLHLSIGMSLSGGVGKVASQPVVLDGSRVMSGSSDKEAGRGSDSNSSSNRGNCARGNSDCSSTAKSDQGGEKQEGVHCGGC